MRAIVALGLVTGCAFHPNGVAVDPDGPVGTTVDAPADAALPDSPLGTGRRKPITIDHTKVLGALTDFPVWIDLGSDADLRDRAETTASDVFFTDATGTPIPWELAGWDPATGHLTAWVRTNVDAVTDTTLYIYFGDPQANHPPAPATVFSNGFEAVWHLDGIGAGSAIADATGQTPATGNLPANSLTAGQLGQALDFNGSTHQIDFQNPITGGGPHTISAWVDQRNSPNDDCLIALGTGTTDRARFVHTTYQAGHTLGLGFYSDDFNSGVDLRNQGFRLIHWVYDATTSHLYVDGREVQNSPQQPNSSISTMGTDGFIGNIPGTKGFGANMGINAKVDEVRIANVARSAAWVGTEHANQRSPATFVTVGAIEIVN